jgi:hypothetical protein
MRLRIFIQAQIVRVAEQYLACRRQIHGSSAANEQACPASLSSRCICAVTVDWVEFNLAAASGAPNRAPSWGRAADARHDDEQTGARVISGRNPVTLVTLAIRNPVLVYLMTKAPKPHGSTSGKETMRA